MSDSGWWSLWGLVCVASVALKLFGVVQWAWWWVLAPAWVPLATSLLICLIFAVWIQVMK